LNLGIEFQGGTSWTVTVPSGQSPPSVAQVSSNVQAAGVQNPTVQILGNKTVVVQADLKRLPQAVRSAQITKVQVSLAQLTNTTANQVSIQDVGPTWGSEVTKKAVEAMIVFFVLVTIYISFRFQWRMAIAALLKVILHDLLITIGIFSLVGFQVTPAAVIAVLTIMGYSLYDTVVVFDKITENSKGLGASRRMSYQDMVNLSLNQVLARSLNTSLVAVLPVLSILIIGAQVLGATTLQSFGLPLVIGIVAGAYSSIFIAAPARSGTKADRLRGTGGKGSASTLLTPKAAAQLSGSRSGGGGGGRVVPGQAGAKTGAKAATGSPNGAGASAGGNGGGAGSGPRRPPPRPRKKKGGKRR
ncbi:MAG TPA: protein translocase subunit SecF, partial [Acidimicrobiales bacterium]|nr:protein translocase subunit SecF [Acidimicrobiales bacterium]